MQLLTFTGHSCSARSRHAVQLSQGQPGSLQGSRRCRPRPAHECLRLRPGLHLRLALRSRLSRSLRAASLLPVLQQLGQVLIRVPQEPRPVQILHAGQLQLGRMALCLTARAPLLLLLLLLALLGWVRDGRQSWGVLSWVQGCCRGPSWSVLSCRRVLLELPGLLRARAGVWPGEWPGVGLLHLRASLGRQAA